MQIRKSASFRNVCNKTHVVRMDVQLVQYVSLVRQIRLKMLLFFLLCWV